jgi:RHS repeat-associated protein
VKSSLLNRFGSIFCSFSLVCLSTLAEAPPPVEGEGGNPGWLMASPPPEPAGERVSSLAEAESGLSVASISTNGADAVTADIIELARGLDNDPVRLYEFVHNHIRFEPYYGSLKGATRTLRDRAGNDCDQASLLVALLRQSNVDSKYAYGTLTLPTIAYDGTPNAWNWLGASDPLDALRKGGIPATAGSGGSTLTLDFICVDAYVSNAWVRLAPSLKAYDVSAAQELAAMMGYDRSQVLAAAGGTATSDYAQNLTEQALRLKLDGLSSNLLVSLQDNMPNASVEEVMGGRKIREDSYSALPTNLPSSCVFAFGQNYVTVPTNLEHRVKIQYGGITNTLALHNIAHRKLTMKYDQLIVGSASAMGAQEVGVAEAGGASLPPPDSQEPVTAMAESTPGSLSPTTPDILTTNQVLSAPEGTFSPTNSIQATTNESFGIVPQGYYAEGPIDLAYYNASGLTWTLVCSMVSNPQNAFSITAGSGTTYLASGNMFQFRAKFDASGQSRGVKTATIRVTVYPYGFVNDYNLTGTVAETPQMGFAYFVSEAFMNEPVTSICSITNNGSQTMTIQSISLANNQNNQFQILGGNGSGTIPPGQRRDITVKYLATTHGASYGDLVFDIAYDGYDYPPFTNTMMLGQAYYKPVLSVNTWPDFGQYRYYGESIQSNIVIRNAGGLQLSVSSGTRTGPDAARYEVVSGGGSATVPVNGTYTACIRYKADQEGMHTNAFFRLNYTYDGKSLYSDFQLIAQTLSRPRASLLLDDTILNAESSSVSGTVATCTLAITHPYSNCNQTVTFPFKRGSLYAIMCGFGDAESGLTLARNQRQLEALRAKASDSSSAVLSQCLHVMGQTWLDESALVNQSIERISGVSPISHHRFGVMAQEAGYYVDVKAQVSSYYSSESGGMAVGAGMKAGSLVASSLEHAILEQLQGADRSGVSTVKLLQMANANGEKIYRMTASNAVSVLAALTNYSDEVKNQFLGSATNGLVQVLPRNGAITAGQWVGNGYVTFGSLPSGQYQVGMIISGDYHGGYSSYYGQLESLIAVNAQHNIVARAAEARYPVSADPVDLATGSFLYSADDLALGGADPVGLKFSHYYSSLDATRLRAIGYGWTHNYDVYIEEHSSWQGGMGLRTPAEAVPLMVAAFVAGDLAASEDNPKGWATAALVSKWATDQLTTNAVTVYLGNRALTFIRLPDGRYTPPPGVTMSLSKTNGLYTLAERNGREYRFNATRRLASIVDPDNNTMNLAYNAATNLSTVTDACGRSLTFNYSAALLTNVVDSTGRSVTMQGDAASNLSAFTDSAGAVWRFVYDTNHCLTATVEPGGVTNALNTYDSLSRVKQQANGRGLVSQLLYADYRTVEQDPAGNRKTYYFDDKQREIGRELVPGAAAWSAYDGQNHTVATMDPLSRLNYAFYDGNHNVRWTVDPLNQVSSFNYDSLNRLVEAVTPLGLTTRTEYDSKHHPIRITGPASNSVECVYSASGLLEKKIEIPAAAAGGGTPRTNSWAYSSWRTPTEMFHPDGSREAFNYNARGDLLTHTDTRSNTTVFTYDNRGLRLSQTDALGGIASNNWNALGLLVSSTDQRGKTTAFTYTKTREPASATAPDGGVVSNVYDNAGRVIAVINPRSGVTSNTWDSAGRLIAKRDPNGVTVRLTYDSIGNVLATTDGLGNVSTNIYDTLNRLVEARSPNGAVATTEYDADSRVTAVVDTLGRRTEFTLDALGRKVAVKRPDNRFERYTFDGHGNLLAFTNAAGNVQCFMYDSMGRKTGESNAVGTVRSYGFDAAGNLSAKTDGNGRVTTFSYNAANRLAGLHYADNSVVTFTNDAAGNLTGMGDPWGTGASAASYDNVGRLSAWTDHHNSTVQYRYDKAGGITNISYPGNLSVIYGWDTAGRLASVKDWANRTWNFSYDGANRLSGIQYPNGVNYTRGHNADGQLTNYVHSKSGTPFISRTFERNSAGLKTREVISAGLEVEPPDTWQKHTSDKGDRLNSLTRRDEYVVPERWRGYTPSYNQEGQVTNVCEGYQSWASENNLIWDAAGRLVEYTGLRQTNLWTDMPPMPSWGLNLAYDGLGERTVRTDELVTHRMVVDRVGRLRVPLMETDDSNCAIRYYIWAPGIGLLAQIEANSTIHYIHADENGSTLAMTDSNGNVTDQFAYSPWGELLGRTGTNTTAFTFVGGGGVTWEGGNLYRMGARYYDARLKRWLSADPAGMAGGANLYLYANGNPLYWVDMLGLCGQTYLQNSGPEWMYSDAPVEGPGLVGGAVPLIGPMREAAANRMNGQYGWMAVNTAFAMADLGTLGRATVVRDLLGVGIRETGEMLARDTMEDSVVNVAKRVGSLPTGEMPYQLTLFPDEAYNRVAQYGRTPTSAQRASVPLGMEFDHNPTLVQHYYEGLDGGLPGFNLTQTERLQYSQNLSSGAAATPAAQRAQGAAAAAYSKAQKQLWGLQ